MTTPKTRTRRSSFTVGVVVVLVGVLMSACMPAVPVAPVSSTPPPNPHEMINGGPVGIGPDLQAAVNSAYTLHRDLLGLLDPSSFTGNYEFLPMNTRRQSNETPDMMDGQSFWHLYTTSDLKQGLAYDAMYQKLKIFMLSQGWTIRDGEEKTAGVGSAFSAMTKFRKDGPVNYLVLSLGGGPPAGIGITVQTRAYPNPPVKTWPTIRVWPEQSDPEWRPVVSLWPTGVGPVPGPYSVDVPSSSPSPTPSSTQSPSK